MPPMLRSRTHVRAVVALIGCTVAMAPACGDDAERGNADGDVTIDVGDTSDTSARPDVPTPWIYPEDPDDEVTPALATPTLQSALTTAISAALELDPRVVLDLHEALFPTPEAGSGDPTGCPFYLTYDYGTAKAFYWQGECTASDGTMFSGFGSVATYDDFVNEAGTFDGYDVNMAGRIEAADGTFLEGSGQAGSYAGAAGDLASTAAVIDGTFSAGGPRAPASVWLRGHRRPSLNVTGWTYKPTGGTNVTINGGISGLDFPDGVSAVSLDDVTAREALAGATCERELGGAAGVRGDDGNWYDVLFDGPLGEDAETPGELCDGCGETWFRGHSVDETCVDAKAYFDWTAAGWSGEGPGDEEVP